MESQSACTQESMLQDHSKILITALAAQFRPVNEDPLSEQCVGKNVLSWHESAISLSCHAPCITFWFWETLLSSKNTTYCMKQKRAKCLVARCLLLRWGHVCNKRMSHIFYVVSSDPSSAKHSGHLTSRLTSGPLTSRVLDYILTAKYMLKHFFLPQLSIVSLSVVDKIWRSCR